MKTTPKSNRQIVDEASEWFVEFRVGDVDAAARERFDEWVRRSPEHIRAYIEIARTYVEMPNPHGTKPLDVEALIAYAKSEGNIVPLSAGEFSRETGRTAGRPHETAKVTSRPESVWLRRRALAASLLTGLVALAGMAVWQTQRYPSYATDVGERRSLTLSDGSTVDLNARSKLRIEFSKAERRVELIEGQALFQVAKNKDRPFIVKSGEATVRAVGTQFDVDRKATGTTVTVLEGRVVVYSHAAGALAPQASASTESPGGRAAPPRSAAAPQIRRQSSAGGAAPSVPPDLLPPDESGSAVFVGTGEQVTVTPQVFTPPEHADLTAATAWMQRRLIFDGTKLADVVEEFNRHNRRRLVIEGKSLSDYQVSGVYSSTDPASLLRFLREQPGMKVTESENEVHIAPK
jgi:transmembrane sensor